MTNAAPCADLATLRELRKSEQWLEIWSIVAEQLHQNPNLKIPVAAEGAFALARLGKAEEAEQLAQLVLQAEANVLATRALVVARLNQKRVDEALALAQRVFTPPFVLATAEEAAQAIVTLASVHKERNEPDKVRTLLAEANRLYPLPNSYFLLAVTELAQGELENGAEALKAGLALNPFAIVFWMMLANTWHQLNRAEDMLRTYQAALAYYPDHAELLATLGEWYTRLHRYDEAEQLLRKVTTQHPDYLNGWVNLGKMLYDRKIHITEAVDAFKNAIRIKPECPELIFNLARIYFKDAEKHEEALIILEKAYSLAPNNTEIALTLAEAYARLKNIEKGKALLDKISNGNPLDPLTLQVQARFCYMDEKFDDGLAQMQKALSQELWFLRQQPRLSLFGDGAQPYMDVYNGSQALIGVSQFLTQLGVTHFLLAGTLLGIVRDGELLPHDKDADLGIAWDVDRNWLMQQFEESKDFGINGGKPSAGKALWNYSVVRKGTPVGVDFFFQKPDGDDWLMGIDSNPTPWLQRFKQRPLTTIDYKGHKLPIPENPEGYLEEVYGPDWRKPLPCYDTLIAADNLCPESYLTAKIIGYNRLYEVLMNRSWKKVLWYCEALKRFDNPPILDELADWLREAMPADAASETR